MSAALAKEYPVDVCYMVADLKYSAKHGVKICEVQQASLSMFNGDTFRNSEEESIHKELLRTLSSYNKHGWVVDEAMADKKLVSTLAGAPAWQSPKDLVALFRDPNFKIHANQLPKDAHDLSTYSGFLYMSWSQLSVIYDFETRLPGMVVVDKSSFPFWIDKNRMTQLFAGDTLLTALRPKWGNYKKTYTKKLAAKIANDLKCETFVIKPHGNFMGKGVIIVQEKDLDKTLHYIITKKGKLADSKDSAYTAWGKDSSNSFIVEEFVASDPIKLPHLENRTYQPTMRVAFLLAYNQKHHSVDFLGGYWKTPAVSLDEKGDFMQKNKDVCKAPYYRAVDARTMHLVEEQLGAALPRLHSKMLQFSPGTNEEFYAPAKGAKLQVVRQ